MGGSLVAVHERANGLFTMSTQGSEDTEKSHDPTPQKLKKAREKGEVARSTDLSVASSYAGLLLASLAIGPQSVVAIGGVLSDLLGQPDVIRDQIFGSHGGTTAGMLILEISSTVLPWFAVPAAVVLLSILAQRAFVVAPAKIKPKLSRISITSNARNKFGRSGLFEFFKSFAKLVSYSICLGAFIWVNLPEFLALLRSGPEIVAAQMARFSTEFLLLILLVSGLIGFVDAVWQHTEHLRKNRMSHKEMTDESKEAEGDPHFKNKRRARAQEIAMNQMMSDVPRADVIIVNPTHFAIALEWSRQPGSAPVCVAKGVDEVALSIRRAAEQAGVPIHSDPPTARALCATVEIGQEIPEEQYRAVAAAIRFAQDMRDRARARVW